MRQARHVTMTIVGLATSVVVVTLWIRPHEGSVLPLPRRTSGGESGRALPGALSVDSGAATRAGAAAVPATFVPQALHATVRGPWRLVEGPTPALSGLVNGCVHDARRVVVDRGQFTELDVGSLVPLDLPDGQHLLARVQSLELFENGDRSWSGHVEGFGTRYPVVFTQGDEVAFGTIATPTGLFALEAQGEEAVLFRDEREGLQDPARECFLLPG